MGLVVTLWLAVATLTIAGNSLILSSPPRATAATDRRWPCMPDCACLAGSGDDVTGSRGSWELCATSVEVGTLSVSRLASVKRLSIVGRPLSALVAAARKLKNVRRLQIIEGGGGVDVEYWLQLFSAFNRLHELTIRNSSTAASAAAALSAGRLLPKLRKMDLSESGLRVVELTSLQQLRNLRLLDLSGNALTQLTDANNTDCIAFDEDGATSVSTLNSTSGPPSPTTKPYMEMCRPSNETSDMMISSTVRIFNASRNQIDAIDVGLFDRKSGRKLELLDLSFNELSQIVNGTFTDLYALRSINLSHNVISDVQVDAFTLTSDDEQPGATADVGYQATGQQPEEQYYISLASCTRGWLSIQVVDLSYNKLTFLREGLLEQALCAVRRLILSNNKIDRLPRYLLEHLPYLTHIDLSDNALTWLDVGAFTNPSLSVIDLSGNRLRKIVSMTFLYLPALTSVDLAHNEISYVYKFAFYRMCSDASRPIVVSLRANKLDVDAVWKLLTTFEHLEDPGCRVLVDLRDNRIERFLAPETLEFVRKRVVAAAADFEDAQSQLKHFRRWTHVTADLTGNRIRCDCALATELRTTDTVLEMIGGNGSKADDDLIAKSWRRLNCCEPIEHAGLSVGTFVDSIAPTVCDSEFSTRKESATSYGLCSSYSSQNNLGKATTVNCSGKHLTEFPSIPTRAATSTEIGVQILDLSNNKLRAVRADLLRALYPSLRVVLLHNNLITSLPVALINGASLSLTSLTLAGNPLTCDCAQPWLSHSNVVRLSTIVSDWHDTKCADGRPLRRFSTSGYRCAGVTARRHPGTMWSVAVALGCLLVIGLGLTLIGLVVRLVRWAMCGRRRRTRIYDVISVDGGAEIGSKIPMVVLVVYCSADDEWVHSKLMPLLRQSSSPMTSVVRLSLKTIDANRLQTSSRRKFVKNLRRSLAECHLAVVVVSSNLVDELSRRGDAVFSGFLVHDSAPRCVYVSANGDVGAGGVQAARRVFGPGVWCVTSDDDVMEQVRAEMTSLMTQSHRPRAPFHISQHQEDANQQRIATDEKY